MRPKFHNLRISDVRRETSDCVSVAFKIPDELKEVYQFKAGQNLTLRQTINGEDIRRSYSICSGVNEKELRVAVKEVAHGAFSSWVNRELKAGDEMQVMTPSGNFTVPLLHENEKNYLFFAAGSGITPIISLAKSVLSVEPKSEVTLIYGNRLFNTIIFREELEDMKDRYLGRFRVFHVLSGEPNEIPLFHGRIDYTRCELFAKTFIDISKVDEAFVCGPEPMIFSVSGFLVEQGVPKEHVHFELFATPGQVQFGAHKEPVNIAPSGKNCNVKVIFDGYETEFNMKMDGSKILDSAQKAGLDIPFSCKGGMCCTCRAHLDEGSVEMEVNYALEPGEVENGFVLTCQSVPTSDKVVVNFDKQ